MGTLQKGQIATEFLNTYAWAIVAVFVAVAALWALGVFNAQPPKSCFLGDGLSCYDFAVDPNGKLHLDVGQGTGRAITVTGVGCSVNNTPTIISVPAVIIQNKQHAFITTSDGIACDGAQTTGQAFRGTVIIQYRANDLTFNQTSKGDISSPFVTVTGGDNGAPTPTPIVGSGTIMYCTDATYYIMTSGTYLLGSDLNSTTHICIIIVANDTTLDCQGHTINGFNAGPTGVYGDHLRNVTVQNCTITGYGYGLFLGQINNSLITGNSFSNNNQAGSSSFGMELQDATNTLVSSNNFNSNGQSGLQVTGSSHCNFTENTANSNGRMGFDIGTTSSCRFVSNTANYNGNGSAGPMYAGIYLNSGATNNVFTDNIARWNKLYGIHNSGGNTGNNLSGNNFCDNNQTTYDTHCYTALTDTGSNSCRVDDGCSITCGVCSPTPCVEMSDPGGSQPAGPVGGAVVYGHVYSGDGGVYIPYANYTATCLTNGNNASWHADDHGYYLMNFSCPWSTQVRVDASSYPQDVCIMPGVCTCFEGGTGTYTDTLSSAGSKLINVNLTGPPPT